MSRCGDVDPRVVRVRDGIAVLVRPARRDDVDVRGAAHPGDLLRELTARELTRSEVDRDVEAAVAAVVVEVAELVVDDVRDVDVDVG